MDCHTQNLVQTFLLVQTFQTNTCIQEKRQHEKKRDKIREDSVHI